MVRDWRDRATEGFPRPIGRCSNAFVYDPDQVQAWWAARELRDDRWTVQPVAAEFLPRDAPPSFTTTQFADAWAAGLASTPDRKQWSTPVRIRRSLPLFMRGGSAP